MYYIDTPHLRSRSIYLSFLIGSLKLPLTPEVDVRESQGVVHFGEYPLHF